MNRRILPAITLATILALTLCSLALSPAANASERAVTLHFFVVTDILPDGASAAPRLPELRLFLAKLAGGYTELGPGQGGFMNAANQLVSEQNHSFLVSADKDLSGEIRAYLDANFPAAMQYILVWKALQPG